MQIDDIIAMTADQDRGTWYDLSDPVTGIQTGIRLRVAGPDSDVQNRARLRLADDLADMADPEGRVSAETRERIRIDSLARCILDWEAREGGAELPFSHANAVRLLRSAQWVQEQVDAFASDRVSHRRVS
jgi:hypothetical protein